MYFYFMPMKFCFHKHVVFFGKGCIYAVKVEISLAFNLK